jgi:hypothetical protein
MIVSPSPNRKAHFFGAISTNMNKMVWKIWVPPKTKSFAWLTLHHKRRLIGAAKL